MKAGYTEETKFKQNSPKYDIIKHIQTVSNLFNAMSETNPLFTFLNDCNYDILNGIDVNKLIEETQETERHGLEKYALFKTELEISWKSPILWKSESGQRIRANIDELYRRLFICNTQGDPQMEYIDYFILTRQVHPNVASQYPELTEEEIKNIFMMHLWTFVADTRFDSAEDTQLEGRMIDTYVNDEVTDVTRDLQQKTLKYREISSGILDKIDMNEYALVKVEFPHEIDDVYPYDYHCVYFYIEETPYFVYILPEEADVLYFLQAVNEKHFKRIEQYGYMVVSREVYDRIRIGTYKGFLRFIGSHQVGVVVTKDNVERLYVTGKRPVNNRIEMNGFSTIRPQETLIPIDGIDDEKEYWHLCNKPITIERTFKIRAHQPVCHLDLRCMHVIGQYTSGMTDLINISKIKKEYRGLINTFTYNPVPIRNEKEYCLFDGVMHETNERWVYWHYDDMNGKKTPEELTRYYVAKHRILHDLNEAVTIKQRTGN